MQWQDVLRIVAPRLVTGAVGALVAFLADVGLLDAALSDALRQVLFGW